MFETDGDGGMFVSAASAPKAKTEVKASASTPGKRKGGFELSAGCRESEGQIDVDAGRRAASGSA